MTAMPMASGAVGALAELPRVAQRVSAALRAVADQLRLLEPASLEPSGFLDDEVVETLELVDGVSRQLAVARFVLAREAVERGLPGESGWTLVDWLVRRCPGLTRAEAVDLGRVAEAAREAVHAPLVDGVLGAELSVQAASSVLRSLGRVRGGMTAEEYDRAVGLLTEAARHPQVEERDLRRVLQEFVAVCLGERELDERAKAKRGLRDVHESCLADGSVKRLIVTFGDDADYEAVRAVLTSPLAAPARRAEVEATGEPDTRTAGQRRYETLMMVLRRGVAGTKGEPTTPKAQLVVTMAYDALAQALTGAGRSLLDGQVPPQAARRLACDADLIPLVLGSAGEIVDQGRKVRLVTAGQRLRLALRDGCCTIPGCTVPATWCDAHHVEPWWLGGPSDLRNYALLCPRHHTWVHDHGKTATVTATGVTWHD